MPKHKKKRRLNLHLYDEQIDVWADLIRRGKVRGDQALLDEVIKECDKTFPEYRVTFQSGKN